MEHFSKRCVVLSTKIVAHLHGLVISTIYNYIDVLHLHSPMTLHEVQKQYHTNG